MLLVVSVVYCIPNWADEVEFRVQFPRLNPYFPLVAKELSQGSSMLTLAGLAAGYVVVGDRTLWLIYCCRDGERGEVYSCSR